jgi:uncharacterized protein
MWLRLIFAVMIVALGREAHAASSWFWCEPLHAYYPWVRSCPEAWRQVDPGSPPSQQPQFEQSQTPSQAADTAPVPSSAAGLPTFPAPVTASRGDGLDQWCQGSITALNIAICTDNDLRAGAVQRLHAFDDAKARLTPDQQKTLAADQNGWAMSYGESCGVHADIAPTLPLAPSVKECLAHAGQVRLAYLRSYGSPMASGPLPQTLASSTPVSAPPASAAKTASTTQEAAPPPAPANETSSASAPAVSLPPSPDTKAAAAVSSCSLASTRASANPFGGGNRFPALGTLQGQTMVASLLLASATICLWIFAVFRNVRREPR